MDAFRFAVSGVVGVSAGHDSEGLKAVVNDGRLTGWPAQPFSDPVCALFGTNAGACTHLLEPLVYLTALIDLFACIKIDWH